MPWRRRAEERPRPGWWCSVGALSMVAPSSPAASSRSPPGTSGRPRTRLPDGGVACARREGAAPVGTEVWAHPPDRGGVPGLRGRYGRHYDPDRGGSWGPGIRPREGVLHRPGGDRAPARPGARELAPEAAPLRGHVAADWPGALSAGGGEAAGPGYVGGSLTPFGRSSGAGVRAPGGRAPRRAPARERAEGPPVSVEER